ncbi:hypothetical protein TanjilG_22144 [Lupinus angustifolius]|uniref:peptidylprolyl isomerase n=1 Tax=Lupinus angustifolius TaxID=3871 RepID=A0A4P1QU72_LUPAN|nr:PREDICTED: peptidyl-prolyl cis-trans isomerase FKBP53-like [Lupinus angustifolius]OIV94947.1 hypothetical protein TanjilG_22144 [Lupinus angustifolius]
MGFWGIEVKPGKSTPYHADNVQGKLRVTQATLGIGSSAEKSILQCSSGHKSPVFLCSLLPNKIESCPLNLEFDDDDLVAFSVVGPRSIHLSGYFVTVDGDDYEYDSFDEDAEGSETEESSEHDSEDGYDFIDDSDADMYPSSHIPNSGVVIEEIVDDDKPESGDDPTKQLKKKKQVAHLKEDKSSHLPIVVRGETVPPNLEDEDDAEENEDKDGFPISVAEKGKSESPKEETEIKEEQAHKKTEKANKRAKQVDHSASIKRKVENAEEDEQQQDGKKKKKRKDKLKEHGKGESSHASDNINETNETTPDEKHPEEVKTTVDVNDVSHAKDGQPLSNNEVLVEKKNKKKNKKKTTKESEEATTPNQIANTVENKDLSISEKSGKKQTEDKPSQVRSFANGLVIEELSTGKPDGKSATPGKKVSVKYIGKLKKNGKIFDSNVGRATFKFRLGLGQVIKGWEVGVNGMRIGDKRRITVPPSMGYGDKRAGSIPPNSWLVFDVELVNVGG